MSYAEVTAKNSEQSAKDAAAPQLPELEHNETSSTASLIDVDSPHVSSVPSDFNSQGVKTTTQADRIEREESAKQRAKELRAKASAKASRAGDRVRLNADNPVVLANAVLSVALFGAFGYGAYVRYRAGELSWKIVGIGASILGAFSVADYYVSSYFFKKYPPKK